MAEHRHLRRLERVWVPGAVYFITVCTHGRRRLLASREATAILRQEWAAARERHGWQVGRFVVMPDHVHFFCVEQAADARHALSRFMDGWKEWTAKKICRALSLPAPLWQPQFFDHVLRSEDSYGEKWSYVRENPVRAGLVAAWEMWPYQGFVDFDHPRGG